jgi:hypothetical protein
MRKNIFKFAFGVLFVMSFGAYGAAAQSAVTFSGTWHSGGRFDASTLTIKKISANRFSFKIEASNGANMGEVSGTATVKGKKAYFNDRLSNKSKDDRTDCKLTFTLAGKLLKLAQTFECQEFAGSGVFFQGDYERGKWTKPDDTLSGDGVLPNASIDNKLRLLVGKDYEKFLDSFHLWGDDETDAEIGATVKTGCVRGICPWNAAIIAFDKKGNLWAAVIYLDKDDKVFAWYYTNVASWTGKLPKSIEAWVADKRESSEDLQVVYKSKK